MLREIAGLGFSHAELSHGIRIVLRPGILRAVEEGVVKISSTHNFCPLPAGVTQAAPNLFEPSSDETREHDQWLRYTKRSIDFAAQVKASVLVTHLGSTKFWLFPPGKKIKAYLDSHPDSSVANDPTYKTLLTRAGSKLRDRMEPFWKQTLKSLGEINTYAKERGISIGCENREKFEELPVDDDFPSLFETLGPDSACGYWHDTGHGEIKQRMGLLDQRQHLQRNADRLLGFHLHDTSAKGKDHMPVGSGTVNFEMISEFWRPHHLLTLEFSPRLNPDDVLESKSRIEALIARRFPG